MNRNSHDLRWTFLPRDAMHKRGLCCHAVFVRLSVCVSVTFVSCKVEFYARVIKSEAAVTGNKKLCCRYVEADYRQTQSSAVSLRQLSFLLLLYCSTHSVCYHHCLPFQPIADNVYNFYCCVPANGKCHCMQTRGSAVATD